MAKSKNSLLIFGIIIAVLCIIVYFTVYNKKDKNNLETYDYSLVDDKKVDFELIGIQDNNDAFELGFGMGPGVYGSGRQTSSMIGN